LQLADGDRQRVASLLLGGCDEIGELGVGHALGIDAEATGVTLGEAPDEGFGGDESRWSRNSTTETPTAAALAICSVVRSLAAAPGMDGVA